MKKTVLAVLAFGMLGLSAASDASATVTNIDVGGAFVPQYVDRDNWRNDNLAFGASVVDATSTTNMHWARVSVPTNLPGGTVTAGLRVNGGGTGNHLMCTALYSMTSSGTLSSFVGSACTSGLPSSTWLSRSITAGIGSAVMVDMAGQDGASVQYLQISY